MNDFKDFFQKLSKDIQLVQSMDSSGEMDSELFSSEEFCAHLDYWRNKYSPSAPIDFIERSISALGEGAEYDLIRAYSPQHDDFGLLLMGSAGVGKTFVLTAIMADVFKDHYRARATSKIQYSNVGYLLSLLRASRDIEVFERHRLAAILFLDDLGSENVTDYVREQLFTILDLRCQNKLPTIITTNLGFNEITAKYGERFTSRLKQMCVPVILKGTDRRDAVLKDNLQKLKNKPKSEWGSYEQN